MGSTFVGVQRGSPLENVDELVLPGVGVTKGRNCTGSQAREIHAKVCEAEKIAKLAFLSAHHTRRKRLRIYGGLASGRHFGSGDGDWSWLF